MNRIPELLQAARAAEQLVRPSPADSVVPDEARILARLVRGYLAATLGVVALVTLGLLLQLGDSNMSHVATIVGACAIMGLQIAGIRTSWYERLLHGNGQRGIDGIVVALLAINVVQPLIAGPDQISAWGIAITIVFGTLVASSRTAVLLIAVHIASAAVIAVRHASVIDVVSTVTAAVLTVVMGVLIATTARAFRKALRERHQAVAQARDEAERADAMHEHTISQLRRLDTMKDDFVATVSHELLSPMTVIAGLAQTLRHGHTAIDDETLELALDRVGANAQELRSTVARLIEFDSARQVNSPTLAPTLVQDVVTQAVDKVGAAPARLSIAVPAGCTVLADEPSLVSVMSELLMNAVVHTRPTAQIMIGAEQLGDRVRVHLSDESHRSERLQLDDLSAPFARGGRFETRDTRGLGLGLSICQRLLQQQGTQLQQRTDVAGTSLYFDMAIAPSTTDESADHAGWSSTSSQTPA